MRRVALTVALAIASPAVGSAADCARLLDGKTTLTGQLTIVGPEDGARTTRAIRIERGPKTVVTIGKPGDANVVISEYDRGLLLSRAMTRGAATETLTIVNAIGDIWSLQEGTTTSFRYDLALNAQKGLVEDVTQTIGAHSKTTISGCEIDVVRVNHMGVTTPGGRTRSNAYDYAPALGFYLWAEQTIQAKSGPAKASRVVVDSLDAE